MPQPQQLRIGAASVTYTTAHSNARSSTHWARPGIEPKSSWMLVGFANHWAMMGTSWSEFLIQCSGLLGFQRSHIVTKSTLEYVFHSSCVASIVFPLLGAINFIHIYYWSPCPHLPEWKDFFIHDLGFFYSPCILKITGCFFPKHAI